MKGKQMKTQMGMAVAVLVLSATAAVAGNMDFGNGVHSPQKGVICDDQGQWCADGTGLSASWSEQYFGGAAAGKLDGATQDRFGFSNNVNCDINSRSCRGSGAAAQMQAVLFGAESAGAASSAAGGQKDYGDGVTSPRHGVICDSRGQWCADGTGLSASLTEQYFGGAAAAALTNAEQGTFGFSNHVKCSVASQSCAGGSGKSAKKMAKQLFKN